MSKNKDILSKIREKVFDDKKVEIAKTAEEVIEKEVETKVDNKSLDSTLYDVITVSKNEMYLIKVNFNLKTKKAEIEEILPFTNKVVANTVSLGKSNLHKVFEVTKKLQKGSK